MCRFLPHTLRARLTALIVLLVVAVLALSGLAVYGALSARVEAQAEEEMVETMSALQAHLTMLDTKSEIGPPNGGVWEDHLHGRRHMALAIFDVAGKRLLASAGFRDYAPLQDVLSMVVPVRVLVPQTALQYLVAVVSLEGREHSAVRVVIQYDGSADRALLRASGRTIVLIEAVGVAIAAASAYALARIGLSPLRRLAEQAEATSTSRLTQRLPELGGSGELRELGKAFNGMLDHLEDSFGRLSEFSSNLAHDLRTPLTSLMAEAQVALAQPRSAQAYREVIESSIDEYRRLSSMIDDMLFLARAERAAAALSISEFDAAQEAERVASYYESLAQDADVAIVVRGSGRIVADLLLYQRALSNVLANALVYAPRGTVIDIECIEEPEATTITVSDKGPGITAPHIERLFERFYRVDSSRRQSGCGTGLGLAIVKSIMDHHDGACGVRSEPHVRTTFWLRFVRGRAPMLPPGTIGS